LLVMLFSAALGVSVAASTMVGNALGANLPAKAQLYTRFVLALGAVLSVACTGTLFVFGRTVVEMYTDDEAVIDEVLGMLTVVLMCHFGDSAQFALQGIYRGAGMPSQAAMAVLATLWLVGIPAGGVYCLVLGLGVKGVFLGLLTGFAVEIPLLLFLMSRWNWEELAARASAKTIEELDAERRVQAAEKEEKAVEADDSSMVVTDGFDDDNEDNLELAALVVSHQQQAIRIVSVA